MTTTKIELGTVNVDSGQILIVDPSYIDSNWKKIESDTYSDHAHDIYQHKKTGKLWQFTYGNETQENVNKFPGSYATIIPEYNKSPNQLIDSGEFIKSDLDPTPHIHSNEFSYRNLCKTIGDYGSQIQKGLAVISRTGIGDGSYKVFANLIDIEGWGTRVQSVIIEFISEEDLQSPDDV